MFRCGVSQAVAAVTINTISCADPATARNTQISQLQAPSSQLQAPTPAPRKRLPGASPASAKAAHVCVKNLRPSRASVRSCYNGWTTIPSPRKRLPGASPASTKAAHVCVKNLRPSRNRVRPSVQNHRGSKQMKMRIQKRMNKSILLTPDFDLITSTISSRSRFCFF